MTGNLFGPACFALALWVASMPLPQPQVKIIKVRPLTQWTCEPQEFREHQHACEHRKYSDGIK